jgi:hypothetical protein
MTISSTTTAVQTPTNGTTTQFSFGNKIFQAGDLTVTLIDTLGNQYTFIASGTNTFTNSALLLSYTVYNIDVDTGCYIVFTTAPIAGWTLDLRTNVGEVQTTSIKNQSGFLPELHEEFFDRITREVQDLKRLTYTYAIHGPDIETTPWTALPAASVRANSGLIFDASGLPALGVIPSTVFTQSTFNAFLGTSPPYARTALEISAGVTPTSLYYVAGSLRRYGAKGDGTTDDSTALNTANAVGHRILVDGGLTYRIASSPTITTPMFIDASSSLSLDNGQILTVNGPIQISSTFPFSGLGSVVYNYVSLPGRIAQKLPGFCSGVPIYPSAPLDCFGDSYTAGNGATSALTCFASILGARFNAVFNNWGVGGTGVTMPIFQAFSHLPGYKLKQRSMTWMAGFNDLFRKGPTAPTLQKISDCTNAFLANAFLEKAVPASDPSVTATGSWGLTTPGVFGDKASLALGGSSIHTNTLNDTASWTFQGESVVVGFWSSDGTVRILSPFTVTIDGNLVETVTPNGATDGNQGGVDTYQGFTYNVRVYVSLGSGSHTIVLKNTQSNNLFIDYFGTLSAPGECPSVLMGEIAYLNAAGYATETLRSRSIDTTTSLIEEGIVKQWQNWGFPVAWVPVNDYYDVTLNAFSDNIHPSQAGHVQLAQAFASRAYPALISSLMGGSVVKTATQSIANTTNTLISWDAVINNAQNLWAAGSPTIVTLPASGTVRLSGNVGWAFNATGVRTLAIFKNGVSFKTVGGASATPSNELSMSFSLDILVNAGDQISLNVSQNSGSAVSLTTNTQMDIAYIR